MRRSAACLLALGLLFTGHALALTRNSEGLYVDDNGQVIDESESEWGTHLPGYYIGEGVAYLIGGNGDSAPSDETPTVTGTGGMTVTSSDGSSAGLPEGAVINPDGSVTLESGSLQIDDGSTGESGHLTQAEWEARMAKAAARLGSTTGVAYVDGDGTAYPASIVKLGLGRSTITIGEEAFLVPTSSLVWDTEAPEDQKLAVVATTKQTYATLRAKKSQKAFVMGHCDKCTVLLVISVGKTWTMVDDNGLRGYVLTSTLAFYDNQPKEYVPGIITVKGKTPRGNTVHVRSSNKNTARQIAEYPVGTPITVFNQEGKWSEIDVEGLHCFILSEFVTLQDSATMTEPQTILAQNAVQPGEETTDLPEKADPGISAGPERQTGTDNETPSEMRGLEIPLPERLLGRTEPDMPDAEAPVSEASENEAAGPEDMENVPEWDLDDLSGLMRKSRPGSALAAQPEADTAQSREDSLEEAETDAQTVQEDAEASENSAGLKPESKQR